MTRRAALAVLVVAVLVAVAVVRFLDREDSGPSRTEPRSSLVADPRVSRSAAADDSGTAAAEPSPPPLPARPLVTGRVFDAEDGTGIAGARILEPAVGLSAADRVLASADSSGEFAFEPATDDARTYGAAAGGYFSLRGIGAAPGDRLEIALARGVTVAARVVDLDSRDGIAGATIRIDGRETIVPDAEGRFTFVSGPRTTMIFITAPGYRTARFEEIAPLGDEREIVLALESDPARHFRVVDAATRKPLERATIDGRDAERVGEGVFRSFVRSEGETVLAAVSSAGYSTRSVQLRGVARGSIDDRVTPPRVVVPDGGLVALDLEATHD